MRSIPEVQNAKSNPNRNVRINVVSHDAAQRRQESPKKQRPSSKLAERASHILLGYWYAITNSRTRRETVRIDDDGRFCGAAGTYQLVNKC